MFTITTVANLISYKGHRDLIHALWLLKNDFDYRVWCIGRDDGIGNDLIRLTRNLEIADRFRWFTAPNVKWYLEQSDIFVLPSHQEGFSNALLEAMAVGVPCIATSVGGNVDVIGDETGLLVPPSSPVLLARAISRLYGDANLRTKISAMARLHIAKNFSMEACIDKYEAMYRNLV